jgi:hypothetical protein
MGSEIGSWSKDWIVSDDAAESKSMGNHPYPTVFRIFFSSPRTVAPTQRGAYAWLSVHEHASKYKMCVLGKQSDGRKGALVPGVDGVAFDRGIVEAVYEHRQDAFVAATEGD